MGVFDSSIPLGVSHSVGKSWFSGPSPTLLENSDLTTGSSAKSVTPVSSSGSGLGSMFSSMQGVIDQIMKISDRNSARSEAQASELRDWQQRQNALAMEFNATEAAKNRDWQQMMSDTAHQREVADLQAAGLNPVLSASGGNGAPVTSGATASGVTSSGAKGETDMSTTQAFVSLLGTLWMAQTEMQMQQNSALNNLAIADKQRAASEAVANIQGQYSLAGLHVSGETAREVADISGRYNISSSQIYAAASEIVARIGASATLGSAEIHANASAYSAQVSAAASRYASELGYQGAQYKAFVDATTSLAIADLNNETTRRGQDLSHPLESLFSESGLMSDISDFASDVLHGSGLSGIASSARNFYYSRANGAGRYSP